MASYFSESAYVRMLRGYFLHHPEKNQLVHYKCTTDNPIIPAPFSFQVVDEHYFVNCNENSTNIFLTSESIDGQAAAGWFHFYGAGKVCCLTPTHKKEGLFNQDFLRTLANCVKWVSSLEEEII